MVVKSIFSFWVMPQDENIEQSIINKAKSLGIDLGVKGRQEIIREIQTKEGYEACYQNFEKSKNCQRVNCCWQGNCFDIFKNLMEGKK